MGNFLQWLRFCVPKAARGTCSIPDQGTKSLHFTLHESKKKKRSLKWNWFWTWNKHMYREGPVGPEDGLESLQGECDNATEGLTHVASRVARNQTHDLGFICSIVFQSLALTEPEEWSNVTGRWFTDAWTGMPHSDIWIEGLTAHLRIYLPLALLRCYFLFCFVFFQTTLNYTQTSVICTKEIKLWNRSSNSPSS